MTDETEWPTTVYLEHGQADAHEGVWSGVNNLAGNKMPPEEGQREYTRADLPPKVKPLDEDDRAEIIEAAYTAMRKRNQGVGGQLVTEWDSIESYVVQETYRRILSALEE